VTWNVTLTNASPNLHIQVKLWKATNTQTRDFRYKMTDVEWTSTNLAIAAHVHDGAMYTATVPFGNSGYTASLVEVSFTDPGFSKEPLANTWTVTTSTFVGPDTYPSPPCGISCSCGAHC